MRRLYLLLGIMILALTITVQAASKVGTFGAPNSSGTAPLEVDSDRNVTVATDAALVTSTADINGGTVDGATVGANSASTGKFTTLQATTSLDVHGASINWTDVTMVGTGVNWTDTKVLGSGVNWSQLDFQASSGINWQDVYSNTTKGKTAKKACIDTDGNLYGISAGECF